MAKLLSKLSSKQINHKKLTSFQINQWTNQPTQKKKQQTNKKKNSKQFRKKKATKSEAKTPKTQLGQLKTTHKSGQANETHGLGYKGRAKKKLPKIRNKIEQMDKLSSVFDCVKIP